ncbi:MAG TPA: nitroreductase family protein [Opitutaceae bacterium]|nr:nitroreductase family protein [Opitutaceae bacterium]
MDLTEAIYGRRAIRHFTDAPVPTTAIEHLLKAALQAPSATNQQPWAFGVVRGQDQLRKMSDRAKDYILVTLPRDLTLHHIADSLTRPETNVFHDAGTLIVIYAKPARFHPVEDCFLAAQNLMLAAHGLGLGTCPIGFARQWLDLPEIKHELGVPVRYTVAMPIVVGWPAAPAAPVSRREPEIVCWRETPGRGLSAVPFPFARPPTNPPGTS